MVDASRLPPERPEGVVISHINIVEVLTDDGDSVLHYEHSDGHDDDLPIVHFVGLLEMVKSTVLELTLRPEQEED